MNKRQLGNSSLSIAPLVLGGNVFGWTADEATSFAVLDAFVAGAAMPLTPPTATPCGCPAMWGANPKLLLVNG
ncbi:hypothetical protein [Hymenobacter qilianensis]|uniref:hypothetical protein n=1 Tax=Hymenobacter qilianensis TaxID=1385715 RepID=UPI001CB9B3A3|nr:hypothetical protein [Hymenobacter qilianensis]